jgi:hypothetical protein
VFRCETHSHKWGEYASDEPNHSQMHSHFGSYTQVRVANVQNLGWKGKQTPNWALEVTLEIS